MSPHSPSVLEALEYERQELRRQLEALDRAEAALATDAPQPPRNTRAGVQQKAAQHHMDAISDLLARQGRSFQADIGKRLSLNSGTVSLALRQLADAGLVRATGAQRSRSPEWEYVGARQEVHATR